mmetsp:Transcript_41188/g.89754  ORF Transcript_41188/g.89754 Transcript_41188/m.89754 type:complete len:202 (+) Transcript_41188:548-1153(+)
MVSKAFACGIVLGNPSKIKPPSQSGCAILSLMMPITTSSVTRAPESIASLAFSPTSVPAATASRNMSPVESCGNPVFRTIASDCVPFPAPGGPNRTNTARLALTPLGLLGVLKILPGLAAFPDAPEGTSVCSTGSYPTRCRERGNLGRTVGVCITCRTCNSPICRCFESRGSRALSSPRSYFILSYVPSACFRTPSPSYLP